MNTLLEDEKHKVVIVENEQEFKLLPSSGWGNGYVGVTKESPLYGLDYSKIDENIDVHGGLTYSGKQGNFWLFGFDTLHIYSRSMNKDKVKKEAFYLYYQIVGLEQKLINKG